MNMLATNNLKLTEVASKLKMVQREFSKLITTIHISVTFNFKNSTHTQNMTSQQ